MFGCPEPRLESNRRGNPGEDQAAQPVVDGGGAGVGVTGFVVSYLRGRGVGVMGLAVLYLRGGGGVGVMRYGLLLSARCGRAVGVNVALLSLRGGRGVVELGIVSPRDTGSR